VTSATSPISPIFNQQSNQPWTIPQVNYTYTITPNLVNNFIASGNWYSAVLDNPMVEADKRAAMLADVAGRVGLSGVGLNAVKLLAQRKRLASLPEIARRLATLADEKAGVVRATVTSAGPLPESFFERLVTELETATQRKVAIDRQQDPTLIAGVVTRIGDNTIDGSVKGRLAEIERQLASL